MSEVEERRNAPLLSGYDYSRYPEQITGYNGQNLQTVVQSHIHPAIRVRVGPRGNYKGAVCRLNDLSLIHI